MRSVDQEPEDNGNGGVHHKGPANHPLISPEERQIECHGQGDVAKKVEIEQHRKWQREQHHDRWTSWWWTWNMASWGTRWTTRWVTCKSARHDPKVKMDQRCYHSENNDRNL